MSAGDSARESMNNMYRYTRHIYDASRKYFLLGRDVLIRNLRAKPGEHVCEVGCGTARNLIKLAHAYPAARFYGIDASDEMLKTARQSLAAHRLDIKLAQGFAQSFKPALFGVESFDKIVFSYALSIIPPWKESVDHAINILKSGGEIHIIDFGSQERMPESFRRSFFKFLSRFHVYDKPEIIEYLKAQKSGHVIVMESLYKGYANRIVFRKN